MSRTVIVRDHVTIRLRSNRFGVWVDEPTHKVIGYVKELVKTGLAVGAQLNGGIAFEVCLPSGIKAYLMGQLEPGYLVIVTVLTLEQYVGNIRAAGLRSPDKAPSKHKFSRRTRRSADRQLKKQKPWRFDG